MRSFKIVEDDLVITNGDIELIDEDEEKCQCVERAITTQIEEWFLNFSHGMDYSELKEKNPDIERIKLDITEAAMKEERLKFIKEIKVDFNVSTRFAKIDLIGVLVDDRQIVIKEVSI